MSRILRPASQPQNLRAEPEKLEQVTYRSKDSGLDLRWGLTSTVWHVSNVIVESERLKVVSN